MKKLLLMMCLVLMVLTMSACGGTDSTTETSEENSQQVIYEDEYVKVTYLGVSDEMLNVSLENKSDKELSILPMDSYVDGTMVQFVSGTLATIQPGKTFNQCWIIGSTPTEEVGFSLSICGEDMAELVRTDSLKIKVK